MTRLFMTAILFATVSLMMVQGCKSGKVQKQRTDDKTKGLKEDYKDYFKIGVAVSPQGLKRADESQLIIQQFGSMTPENAMKMGPIHPGQNEHFWKDANSIAAFAKLHTLHLRGHNLSWYNHM